MVIFDLDHWQEIWASLRKNKTRTVLTAFGVGWGIFMLVVMLGSGKGLENGVAAGFGDGATNSFFVWTQRTSKPYRGLPRGRRFELTSGDVAAIRQQVPEAAIIAPRNQLGGYRGGNNVTRGTKSGGFSVMGDVPEVRVIQSFSIVEGRFLNPLDLAERRKVAVIGTRVKEVLFEAGEEPLGESVRINGVDFKVIGVFDSPQAGDGGDQDRQTLFVPFTTFQRAFNFGDVVGWLAVTSRADVPATLAEERVIDLLKKRHRVAPDDDRAFGSWNMQKEYDKTQALFGGIQALVWIVGIGTLAAGVIGVSNIMLIIVKERTKEIGLRRAVGATPLSIAQQIVLETILLTSFAGYLGLVAGVGALEAVRAVLASAPPAMFRNPGVELSQALQALAVLVVAGGLAGLLPARRATSISPVMALHSE